MKQVACNQMGGPESCAFTEQANSPEEAVDKMMKHVQEKHPELAAQISQMAPEETSKWMADFRQDFNAKPEVG